LARRFVHPSGRSSHTSQGSLGPAPLPLETPFACSFRTVPVTYWWKERETYSQLLNRRINPDSVELQLLKRELFRKPGEFSPYSYPLGTNAVKTEWEMVYRTPSDSLDARFALSKGVLCSAPCFCRIHAPGMWWQFENACVSCLNYYVIIKEHRFYSDRSLNFRASFDQHVLFCGSELARRFRRRKRLMIGQGVGEPLSFVLGGSEFDPFTIEYS